MPNKLIVIINGLKVPKIKKILLYGMKFLVPNYSCLQNPWLEGYRPPDPRSVSPLSSTEFVEPPPPLPRKNSWIRHCRTYPRREATHDCNETLCTLPSHRTVSLAFMWAHSVAAGNQSRCCELVLTQLTRYQLNFRWI